MAVADRTYTDPTAGIIQAIMAMGGSKDKTSQSTSVDPAALANLQAILGQQMQGTTPEGAAGLLRAIFQGGLEQVPGLATTYAQAAGARSSNNSPLQIAMQDMMLKLTQEGQKQVGTNQVNAANTAANIANATKSVNTTQVKTPKATLMQAAPFLLGAAGKLKGVLPSFDEAANSFGNFFGTGSSGITAGAMADAAPMLSSIGNSGADVFGFDYSAPLTEALTSFAPDISSLSSFGAADAFGFDFGADAVSSVASDVGSAFFDTMGTEDLVGGFLGFDKGGLVGRDGDAVSKKKKKKGYSPTTKPRGYASGGYITADRSDNLLDAFGRPLRGSTQNATTVIPRMLQSGATGNPNPGRIRIPEAKKLPLEQATDSYGISSEDAGMAFGEVGTGITPAGLGAMISIASMAMGVPAIAGMTAANMMGFPAVSPMSTLVNAITNGIAGIGLSGSAGDDSINGPVGAGAALSADTISDDAEGLSPGSVGLGGFGGDSGGPGSSTGGTDGVGDAAAAGVGGGGFAAGGDVKGPKGKDKVPAMLTAGEYVLNPNAVNALGVDFLDIINSMFPSTVGAPAK